MDRSVVPATAPVTPSGGAFRSLIPNPCSRYVPFHGFFPAPHSVAMAAPGRPGPVGFPCDLQAHRKRPAVPRPRPGKHPAVGGRRAAPGPPRSARDDQGPARPGNPARRGLDVLRRPLRACREVAGRPVSGGRSAPRCPGGPPATAGTARPRPRDGLTAVLAALTTLIGPFG